jgi:tetratricopeptide (TPR) repeat protein
MKDSPKATARDFVVSLHNQTADLVRRNNFEAALDIANEAVATCRNLMADHAAFRFDLSSSLSNLGTILWHLGRREDAVSVTQEAAEVARILSGSGMKSDKMQAAKIFSNLSAMFHEQGEPYEALGCLRQVAVVYRERVHDGDTSLRAPLAETLTDIAELLFDIDLLSESGPTIAESLRLYIELEEEHPGRFGDEIDAASALRTRLVQ